MATGADVERAVQRGEEAAAADEEQSGMAASVARCSSSTRVVVEVLTAATLGRSPPLLLLPHALRAHWRMRLTFMMLPVRSSKLISSQEVAMLLPWPSSSRAPRACRRCRASLPWEAVLQCVGGGRGSRTPSLCPPRLLHSLF